jgi:plasmanylethanolamine desaturase
VSPHSRPGTLAALDACAVLAFAFLAVAIARRLLAGPWSQGAALGVAGCAVLGYLLADLLSGVIHWTGDTFFAEDSPIIGRAFIRPFREHHRDPLAITRHGFLEVNGNNCLALLLLLVPTWWLGAPGRPGGPVPWLGFQATALCFALVTFATNEFHKWAHLPGPPPRAVAWLQRWNLVLAPAHHQGHHRPPHRRAYCVTAGWLNPMLDALEVFARCERIVRRLERALARHRAPPGPTSGLAEPS